MGCRIERSAISACDGHSSGRISFPRRVVRSRERRALYGRRTRILVTVNVDSQRAQATIPFWCKRPTEGTLNLQKRRLPLKVLGLAWSVVCHAHRRTKLLRTVAWASTTSLRICLHWGWVWMNAFRRHCLLLLPSSRYTALFQPFVLLIPVVVVEATSAPTPTSTALACSNQSPPSFSLGACAVSVIHILAFPAPANHPEHCRR